MSEENSSQDPQDTSHHEDEDSAFDRGSTLSLFHSDRAEDMLALLFALAVALFVYVNY
ncbi:MAG TPA: hypothetical protein QGH84_01860 [Rhodospirillales bacterium]|jgi:hypothetical protein|nr:hypothetical protein [Rhodospirillales bacterium]